MADPFLGELKLVSFNYAPRGWATCDGQLLSIQQNQALFALLGTQYGGNGQTNFALPNLKGRAPVHRGNEIVQGQQGGAENVSLSLSQLPAHTHALNGVSDLANANAPGLALPAAKPRGGLTRFGPGGSSDSVMDASAVGSVGGSQPHSNLQPYAVLNWVIALQGIFPSRN